MNTNRYKLRSKRCSSPRLLKEPPMQEPALLMKRRAAVLALGSLGLAACGSDDPIDSLVDVLDNDTETQRNGMFPNATAFSPD